MNSPRNWGHKNYMQEVARSLGTEEVRKAESRHRQRQTATAGWQRGDKALFANGIIGEVREVRPTSLLIRIGLGRAQSYSPNTVTRIEKK